MNIINADKRARAIADKNGQRKCYCVHWGVFGFIAGALLILTITAG